MTAALDCCVLAELGWGFSTGVEKVLKTEVCEAGFGMKACCEEKALIGKLEKSWDVGCETREGYPPRLTGMDVWAGIS